MFVHTASLVRVNIATRPAFGIAALVSSILLRWYQEGVVTCDRFRVKVQRGSLCPSTILTQGLPATPESERYGVVFVQLLARRGQILLWRGGLRYL